MTCVLKKLQDAFQILSNDSGIPQAQKPYFNYIMSAVQCKQTEHMLKPVIRAQNEILLFLL